MITTALAPGTRAYRATLPRWSVDPASGAGAARRGGRFNRPRVEAVYLSFDPNTALLEYRQVSPLLRPVTICEFLVAAQRVVDLNQFLADPSGWDSLWAEWNIDWRREAFVLHRDPPTWDLGDMVLEAGYHGILFPSTVSPGGQNLVLYPEHFGEEASLSVLDPQDDLPRDQSSWPAVR